MYHNTIILNLFKFDESYKIRKCKSKTKFKKFAKRKESPVL